MSLRHSKHFTECTYGQNFIKTPLRTKCCKIILFLQGTNISGKFKFKPIKGQGHKIKISVIIKLVMNKSCQILINVLAHGLCGHMSQWPHVMITPPSHISSYLYKSQSSQI